MKTDSQISPPSAVVVRQIRFAVVFLLLLTSNPLSGQNPVVVLDSITAKFTRYCRLFPREEIYVHTDREEYIAGENIWFKVYLFDRQSSRLSSNSNIAYFEILNSGNFPIVRKRIKLDCSLGSGMANLPDTLSSGAYTLRAYTSRMKNFMPDNCFSKVINVYNVLNEGIFRGMSGKTPDTQGADETTRPSGKEGSGLILGINNRNDEAPEIIITTDSTYRSSNNNKYCLFIHNCGNINFRNVISLSPGRNTLAVPGSVLTPGINHITLFNSAGELLAERKGYKPPAENQVLEIADPDSVGIRGKIVLEFQINNWEHRSNNCESLSLSVSPSAGRIGPGIADYMLFGSEFGNIPYDLFKTGLKNLSPATIDSCLMNAGSNWIDWNIVLSGNYPELLFDSERERHIIRGQLLDRTGQGSASGRYVFLSIPGKNAVFQYSLTDEEGRFGFSLPIDEGIRDLILQPENPGQNDVIRMESAFSDKFQASDRMPASKDGVSDFHIRKWGVNYQLRKIYSADSSFLPLIPVSSGRKEKRFYGKPDTELELKDYISLPVMEEVFYELLEGTQLRSRKTGYEITMIDPVYNKPYEKQPGMFIDGVIVHDPSVLAGLDPAKAEKIDLIRSRYVVGNYLFFGLVNVITKTGDFSSVVLPEYAVRMLYRVIDPEYKFYSPSYSDPESKQSRIPDLRNTLYWNPSVKPDKQGKFRIEFWSSDYATDYEINIQGIDSRGAPVSFRKTLRAKK